MHTLSDDKKDGYEIGILSLYPHRPEKEHSRNDFLSRGLPHQQAANVESTLLKGEKQKRLREKAAQNNQISEKTYSFHLETQFLD